VRRNVEAARATVESVEATRDDLLITIQAEVAANYIDVRGTQLQLEVARRNATNQTQTLDLAIALLNGGQGTQLDVARARSLLNETFASIPTLEASLQSAMYRIAVLCGVQPTALTNELLAAQTFPKIPTELSLTSPTAKIDRFKLRFLTRVVTRIGNRIERTGIRLGGFNIPQPIVESAKQPPYDTKATVIRPKRVKIRRRR